MARPSPKGWCPGAYRPMQSGDGLIVRVRPRLARLSAEQSTGLAEISMVFGNGTIDLTNRANLQLRGVQPAGIDPVLKKLDDLGLLDKDEATETRRNVLCAPDWESGDETHQLTTELLARLAELPTLPAKFGFAIDAGVAPVLSDASADIRIERGSSGGLILRADGSPLGMPLAVHDAIDRLVALAKWFIGAGGTSRMAKLIGETPLPDWSRPSEPPAKPRKIPLPGLTEFGRYIGIAFGQMDASALAELAKSSIRVTPWRLLLLESVDIPLPTGRMILHEDDALLRIDACPGAPMCSAASVQTRSVALGMKPPPGRSLHISGCAKGCARAKPADVTLVGRSGRFDVVKHGSAWDMPVLTGLLPEEITGALDALYL